MKKLNVGLPYGSLNDKERCNLLGFLAKAGIRLKGYGYKDRSSSRLAFIGEPQLNPFFCRPKNAPEELARGDYDIAFIGKDWREEWRYCSIELEELLDLGIGITRVVVGVDKATKANSLEALYFQARRPLVIYSEYPNLAAGFVRKKVFPCIFGECTEDEMPIPIINRGGTKSGSYDGIVIVQSFGGTEFAIRRGSADAVIECVQRGNGFKENGVKPLDEVMTSSCRLYSRPDLSEDKTKYSMAMQLVERLERAKW